HQIEPERRPRSTPACRMQEFDRKRDRKQGPGKFKLRDELRRQPIEAHYSTELYDIEIIIRLPRCSQRAPLTTPLRRRLVEIICRRFETNLGTASKLPATSPRSRPGATDRARAIQTGP